MAHPNEEILRRQDDAQAKGDMDAFWSLFTDDVVVHVAGRSSLAGEYKGKQALQELYARYTEVLGDSPIMTTHDLLANDEHGVVLYSVRAEREGKTLEARTANICHFRDGRVSELWSMDEDPYTADPFYG